MKLPPPCVRLACEDPADCINGPGPHEFVCSIDDDPVHGHDLPCVKQSWEYEAILWGPPQDRLHSCAARYVRGARHGPDQQHQVRGR